MLLLSKHKLMLLDLDIPVHIATLWFEALILFLVPNFHLLLLLLFKIENCGGIQGVKEMKELLIRKKHMIHGQEMRNHMGRWLTTVFGAMMNSSNWRLIHLHLPTKDEHLGKRKSHWTLEMWIKQ